MGSTHDGFRGAVPTDSCRAATMVQMSARRDFMSNLKTARMDIEAEIVHAKGGMDSYKFRLIVLEKMLAGLKSLGAEHAAASNQSLALAAAKQLTSFSNSVLERQFG